MQKKPWPTTTLLAITLVAALGGAALGEDKTMTVKQIPGQAPLGTIEIHGVSAGEFQPAHWQDGPPHFLPDERHPLLRPRYQGTFRNIYAPSVVRLKDRFRIFFGAWDGINKSNDCIYSVETPDFFDFSNRHKVIDNGEHHHACNVNVFQMPDGELRMMITVLLKKKPILNKPAVFTSPDGENWNGKPAPCPATLDDVITMEGYDGFADADINGMNVLFHENGTFYIYFCNFKDRNKVFRAKSEDGKHFVFEKIVLDAVGYVNDLKKFQADGDDWYLMGLHANGQELYYSLSTDPAQFDKRLTLGSRMGAEDNYIVAIGWVADGNRVLGYLYGAGEVPGLNRNRIFARWLQKKVVFVDAEGNRHEPTRAVGPDRQLIPFADEKGASNGHLEIYAENGETLLGKQNVKGQSGAVFVVE